MRMQPTWALMLGLGSPFAAPFDGTFCTDSSLSWVARNNSKPGRPEPEAWVLHANPDWSQKHTDADRVWIQRSMQTAFEKLVGEWLPEIEHSSLHRWGQASPSGSQASRVWVDRNAGLALAGDAYMGGRVKGAYLSGRLAADALLGTAELGLGIDQDWR